MHCDTAKQLPAAESKLSRELLSCFQITNNKRLVRSAVDSSIIGMTRGIQPDPTEPVKPPHRAGLKAGDVGLRLYSPALLPLSLTRKRFHYAMHPVSQGELKTSNIYLIVLG